MINILYDEPNNENFQNKIEKVQYKVCLAITDTINWHNRPWGNKLIFFDKVLNSLLQHSTHISLFIFGFFI